MSPSAVKMMDCNPLSSCDMYIHTHIYIHTYIHTYIHIYLYVYVYTCRMSPSAVKMIDCKPLSSCGAPSAARTSCRRLSTCRFADAGRVRNSEFQISHSWNLKSQSPNGLRVDPSTLNPPPDFLQTLEHLPGRSWPLQEIRLCIWGLCTSQYYHWHSTPPWLQPPTAEFCNRYCARYGSPPPPPVLPFNIQYW